MPYFSNVSSKIDEFSDLHIKTEEQFLDYQAMSENDIPSSTWKAPEIADEKSYHMDVIWGYLHAKLPLLPRVAFMFWLFLTVILEKKECFL